MGEGKGVGEGEGIGRKERRGKGDGIDRKDIMGGGEGGGELTWVLLSSRKNVSRHIISNEEDVPRKVEVSYRGHDFELSLSLLLFLFT